MAILIYEAILIPITIEAIAAYPPNAIVLFPFHLFAANVGLIGAEYFGQGQDRTSEEINIDYLPLLPTRDHLFNPDIWK